MLKSLNLHEFSQKAFQAIDNRVKIITAGLGIDELRRVVRGDPPKERPNPRYKVHTTSFLFHIRPRYYQKGSTLFTHTFRLGFFVSFFFFVELVTGIILMIYYTPTPAGAYDSILNLMSNIPFGKLIRDLHRLGAEAMVIFTFLHMFRTYMTGSYKKERSFTWFTGVILLGITLFISFFGYLLPWDQLAYWAVTIGTSMAEAAPIGGNEANLLLRGAPDIGAGGLLRAYLLHVVLLPLVAVLVISIHYYKVSREHGISLPARFVEGDNVSPDKKKDASQRIDYIPDLLTHEVFLTFLGLFIIIFAAIFFYNAPLESIANPQQTPLDTKAPWYFWWLQGMLKLGDKSLMGIVLPTLIVLLFIAVPYIDRNPLRSFTKRPLAVAIGILTLGVLIVLSYMGTPLYAIETPAAARILQDIAPEEGVGQLRSVPYEQLQPGIYQTDITSTEEMCPSIPYGCPELEAVFGEFTQRVDQAIESGKLPDAQGIMVIEEWQVNLKKVTMRIIWSDPESSESKTFEHNYYLHRDRISE